MPATKRVPPQPEEVCLVKATIARAALAGALAVAVAPIATTPSHASCGPVVVEACRVVCSVPNATVYRICTVL